ncbi:MAG TPA: phage holin family protein [Ruminiclostridium sp.]|nr:phage holin family protein [Ruminiclostridium sp.]
MDKVENREGFGLGHLLLRIVIGAVILAITAFLTPGFSISSWFSLLLAAVVLAVLDWAINKITGVNATPFGRGISGFILAAVIIYVIKFIVPGYHISILAAIIAALVYGVVDAIIPGRGM